MSDSLESTLSNIDKLQAQFTELVNVTKGALAIPDLNEKTIKRNYVELCTGAVEKICQDLTKEEATTILCEQISAVQGIKGLQLAQYLATQFKSLGSDDDAENFERSLSACLDNIHDESMATTIADLDSNIPKDAQVEVQRQRFSWAEKM